MATAVHAQLTTPCHGAPWHTINAVHTLTPDATGQGAVLVVQCDRCHRQYSLTAKLERLATR